MNTATTTFAPPDVLPPLSDALVLASQPFVGRWNHLVSTTNWEKGRIIVQWRQSMIAAGVPVTEYSDEAWSRLVGGVSGQHVGRLRRVFQRFGTSYEQFPGLYWSHFQAALDWDDAEMWLEGAQAGGWSVGQMRTMRWETLGRLGNQPRADEIVDSEWDEDFEPANRESIPQAITGKYEEVAGPLSEGPDFGDKALDGEASRKAPFEASDDLAGPDSPAEVIRPFEELPELPEDLGEAFETMKLAILRHKTAGWEEIGRAEMLRVLDALKALVLAP